MRIRAPFLFWLSLTLLFLPWLAAAQAKPAAVAPRAMEWSDIAGWKSIRNAAVSNDGRWLAYRLNPAEGNSEVVLRNTISEKEYRFPIGEAPAFGDYPLAFSYDSRWAVFAVYPDAAEARKLKKERKEAQKKAVLVNLADGRSSEFDKIRSFAFDGERSAWLALSRYGAEGGAGDDREKAEGTDLLLQELSSGQKLNIGNVGEYAFDKKGRFLALAIAAREQNGNGIVLRHMASGVQTVLDSAKAVYLNLSWTEKGDGLACLKGEEDKKFQEKLYTLLGFRALERPVPEKIVYDHRGDPAFPAQTSLSPAFKPQWSTDLATLFCGLRSLKGKPAPEKGADGKETAPAKPKADVDTPDLVIWHWQDPRLQSQQQIDEKKDRDFSYLAVYRPAEKRFLRLADDSLRQIDFKPEARWAVGYDRRHYERDESLSGRALRDVVLVDTYSGQRRPVIKECRWVFDIAPHGEALLFFKDGHYYTCRTADGRCVNITAKVPVSFIDREQDLNQVDPPLRPIGWAKDGRHVLLSDGWDIWRVAADGSGGVNLTVNSRGEQVRYLRRYILDPEEKGIDLTQPLYFSLYGEWTKQSGIARVNGIDGGVERLLWDDAGFDRLLKARLAPTFLYTRETAREFPDYSCSDATLKNPRRLTDANPQIKDFLWCAGSRLLEYKGARGERRQAALWLPAGYEPGKRYPTVVYIYEKLSQIRHQFSTPAYGGFSRSFFTSRGYAVLLPDISYRVNDPGLSAVECITAAVKAAVADGAVDEARIGLHGHSWGGYQTAFTVTQTPLFRAAVAGAPLTDMVSMYSSIYWNVGISNQPLFESEQGRFTAGYWELRENYLRNSPIHFAKQVQTPLLLLHNDKDGAVDFTQGIEFFNTLRRLNKPVVMLQYRGENHGLRRPENTRDYTRRMAEFFDHHLLGKPAPSWLQQGVPWLNMKDYMEEYGNSH